MVNKKQTSARVSSSAAKVLHDKDASQTAKSLAGSALAQAGNKKQTGAELEDLASKVLRSQKYSNDTKELAGSVLSQANKER